MGVPQRRGRLITIQELLEIQRDSVPARCPYCGRDGSDRDRILALEARVSELETQLAGVS